MTSIHHTCPKCGDALPSRAAEGLCSKCLFEALMKEEVNDDTPFATRRFGDYEIVELIARGGMGIVYRARQTSLKRDVALKMITASDDAAPDFVERFRTEAEAAASLDHPNIVSVHDFGEHDDQYFLAMRFVPGGTLGRDAAGEKRADFSPADAARIMGTIARAVHHAHQRGILHRDIKPGNILLDEKGEPHLADFGLAKLIERDSAITRTSAVLGTPSYMAPEQAAGKVREITTAADVYGLGAVLYHLLTGGPPFAGGTTLETIRLVMEQEPKRPSLVNAAVDRDLETICLKCLQKEPAKRYGSAEALADDLDRWRRHEPILARPVSTIERVGKWVRRNRARAALLVTLGMAVLAVAVVSTWMNVRLTAARKIITAQAETRRLELVTLHTATGNRLAEEGDPFAALESFAEAARLDEANPERFFMHRYRFALTRAHAPQLEHFFKHADAVTSVSFNADGSRLVTSCADGTARVWDAGTGATLTPPLAQTPPLRWSGFSPDGTLAATRTAKGEVQLWRADTGAPAGAPWPGQAPWPGRDGGVAALAFSADGAWLAVPGPREAVLHAVAGGENATRTFSTMQRVNHVLFSPDDTRLALVTEGGGAEVRAVATGDRVCVIAPGLYFRNGAWSPDGTRLALADDHFAVRIFDAQTGEPLSPRLPHFAMAAGCRFSPDGRALLTWSFDNFARLFDAADGHPLTPPLRHRGPVRAAVFSADGSRFATASADGSVRMWDAATGEIIGARLPHGDAALDVAFSADGEMLASASADGAVRVWKNPTGGSPRWTWKHGNPVDDVVFSPDGKRVAVMCLSEVVAIWDATTGARIGEPLPHPGRGISAAWLDGQRLVTSCIDGQFRVWDTTAGKLLSTAAAPPKTVGRFHGTAFIAALPDRTREVWDGVAGKRRFVLPTAPGGAVQMDESGKRFVAVHGRELSIQDAATGAARHPARQLDRPAIFATLNPDGTRVAVAFPDFTLLILDTATGAKVAGPLRHLSGLRHAVFTADGRILATSADDRTLRLWDAATGEPLGSPLQHASYVLRISARADGRAFVTASSDGVARLWEIPEAPESPEEMGRIARRLNGRAE